MSSVYSFDGGSNFHINSLGLAYTFLRSFAEHIRISQVIYMVCKEASTQQAWLPRWSKQLQAL